jgi:cyclase
MSLQQVSPHVHVETANLGSNNSIVVGAEGLALIDTPHRFTDAIAWRKVADGLGRTRFVVNTDHHPDHTMGNYFMGGEVVSHIGTRAQLTTNAPTHEYLLDLMNRIDPDAVALLDDYAVRRPDIVFSEKADLHLGDVHLELTFQPGHTMNSLIAYLPEDGVVFTGDIVCESSLPSFQDSRIWYWFDALDAVSAYNFDVLVPGHGEVGDRATIDQYRQWGRDVVGRVAEAKAAGHSLEQACEEIRFDDRIHVDTEHYVGYPDALVDSFQRRSITRIYEDLDIQPELVSR